MAGISWSRVEVDYQMTDTELFSYLVTLTDNGLALTFYGHYLRKTKRHKWVLALGEKWDVYDKRESMKSEPTVPEDLWERARIQFREKLEVQMMKTKIGLESQ